VNGWELSLDAINDLGVKYESWMSTQMGTCYLPKEEKKAHHEVLQHEGRTYFCHKMYLGSIGCVLSHLSVLEDALKSGYETIWIMEDDIEIIRNPHLLSNLIDELDQLVGKNGWDILFTDRDTKNQEGEYVPCHGFAWRPNYIPANPNRFYEKQNVSATFRKIGARFGSYSMIIRKSGIKKILSFLKNYQLFLPYDMEYNLPNGIRMYTVIHDVVSTEPRALSDNGSPQYLKK
jgi:GR25 family glycosyltransferase involved in LPS biosynthesis